MAKSIGFTPSDDNLPQHTLAIVYDEHNQMMQCALCSDWFVHTAGPLVVLRDTGSPVCRYCNCGVSVELSCMLRAAMHWYQLYLPKADETPTVRDVLAAHPQALWKDHSGQRLCTYDLLPTPGDGDVVFPLDLDQPALWTGQSIYLVTDSLQSTVDPLLTLDRTRYFDGSLESALDAHPGQLWLDLGGVYWTAHQLRQTLTLSQRATEVHDCEYIGDDYMADDERTGFDVVPTSRNALLFVLLTDSEDAPRAMQALLAYDDGAMAGDIVSTHTRAATSSDRPYWPPKA